MKFSAKKRSAVEGCLPTIALYHPRPPTTSTTPHPRLRSPTLQLRQATALEFAAKERKTAMCGGGAQEEGSGGGGGGGDRPRGEWGGGAAGDRTDKLSPAQ